MITDSPTRETIVTALTEGLRAHPAVYGLWLEGADAHGLVDEYSDLDFWLDVEDGQADEVFAAIRSILSNLAPLDYDHESPHPHPRIRHLCLHLAGTSEFLDLDVNLQDHSRHIALREGFVDEKVLVLFDKGGTMPTEAVDWPAFRQELSLREAELRAIFPLLCTRTRRPVARGHYLDARGYYGQVLNLLVELARIRYQPTKHDFGLKHVTRDLPPETLTQLERLFTVTSVQDIDDRLREAEAYFAHLTSAPNPKP